MTDPRFEGLLIKIKRRNSLEVYEHVVYTYSRLELAYDDDALNAVEGILSQLQPYLHSPFIFGLPETELVSNLSWRNGDVGLSKAQGERLVRTEGEGISSLRRRMDLRITKVWGPSWSWMGWVGGVLYDYALWSHNGMAYFTVSKDSGPLVL